MKTHKIIRNGIKIAMAGASLTLLMGYFSYRDEGLEFKAYQETQAFEEIFNKDEIEEIEEITEIENIEEITEIEEIEPEIFEDEEIFILEETAKEKTETGQDKVTETLEEITEMGDIENEIYYNSIIEEITRIERENEILQDTIDGNIEYIEYLKTKIQ